jgi:hypothetical protein
MADSLVYLPVAKDEARYGGMMPEPLHYDPYTPPAIDAAGFYPPRSAVPRKKRRFEVLELLKNVCLPIIALGYFAFCYTVHTKIVPVKSMRPVNFSEYDLNTIKSATTALSIIVITLGLLPIKSLVQDLKNEEFFRVLSSRPRGVQLSTVNTISTAAAGNVEAIQAIVSKRSSKYFIVAFLAGLLTMVVSTLAPSALSVTSVLVDGDVVALRVGAVRSNSVLNITNTDALNWGLATDPVEHNSDLAGNIAWAEWSLGARYQFLNPGFNSSGEQAYIVPSPLDLPEGSYARWITDVVSLKPECTWAHTNVSDGIDLKGNFSEELGRHEYVELKDLGLSVQLSPYTLSSYEVALSIMSPLDIVNSTTLDAAPAGTTVWMLAQQKSPALSSYSKPVQFDFNGIPTFDIIGTELTLEIALLTCHPHATIETGIVRNERGKLIIETPLSSPSNPSILRRQGNVHPAQVNFLLSFAMSKIADAGPKVVGSRISTSDMVAAIVFSPDVVRNATDMGFDEVQTWKPVALEDITTGYTSLLQSTSKGYMRGILGNETVPARIATPTLIFTSSLPLTIMAFIIFSLLCVLLALAQFRKGKGENFTFYSIAAALDGSVVPREFSQAKKDGVNIEEVGLGSAALKKDVDPLQAEAAKLSSRPVVLQRDLAGAVRLHLA